MTVDSRFARYALPAIALAAFVLDVLAGTSARDDAALAAAGRGWAPGTPAAPLWCLIARAAALVPLGDVDLRMRLACAALSGLAVLWTGQLATQAGRAQQQPDTSAIWGGITAAALLAVALVFEARATAIDLAPLSIAALAAAGLRLERVASTSDRRAGIELAIACGLGLALAPPFAWIVPVALALAVIRLRGAARIAAPLVIAGIAAALWTTVLIRPSGPDGHAAIASWSTLAERTADSLGPLAALAAVAGALALATRRPWPAIALAAVAIADVAWVRARGGDAVALVWAASIAAGVGAASLIRLTGRFALAAGAGVAALCVLPAAILSLL